MAKNHETSCDPPPGLARVKGYVFRRDLNGVVRARCVWCIKVFDVGETNATDLRQTMVTHQNVVHGRGVR